MGLTMNTKKKTEIRIPILNDEYKIIVVLGGAKEIGRVLKAYHYPEDITHYDLEQMLIDMRGRTFYHKGCYPIIALPKKPKTPEQIGTLAHEAVHAVEHIFNSIQEESRDEVFAHSIGAVVREVLKS